MVGLANVKRLRQHNLAAYLHYYDITLAQHHIIRMAMAFKGIKIWKRKTYLA